MSSRDARFDGQFYFAVKTTGIYCRPSCPSRTPAQRNVEYFPSAAAALGAGYRACKRCLPDAVPGAPGWNSAGNTAGRAMALILDGVVEREGVPGLAARLGYSTRQLGRILKATLGAGPLDLARAQRVQTACRLLVGTELTVADIAHAAGYGSVRQLNDAFRHSYDMTPGELRTRRARPSLAKTEKQGEQRRPGAESKAPVAKGGVDTRLTVRVDLPLRNPYDAAALVDFLAARAIAGVESAGAAGGGSLHYARTLQVPHGPGAFNAIYTPVPSEAPAWRATATIELSDLADLAPAVARIRRILDLDADPVAIARTVPHPGIRLPGAVDGTEIAVRAIVGQQISVKVASTHLSRLAERLGTAYESGIPGLNRLFPTARQLVEGLPEPLPGTPPDPDRPLRLPARGVATVRRIATAISAGELRLDLGMDTREMTDALVALKGVGPWTAQYIAMRLLGDPDVWPAGDLYLKHVDAGAARAYAPWRSYAVMYVWHANAVTPSTRKENPA